MIKFCLYVLNLFWTALACIQLRVKWYGTITGTIETIQYFIATAIGILNYAKYTLSIVPDINLKRIGCLSGISITSCEN